jgi:type IV pilus assembly protein PilC
MLYKYEATTSEGEAKTGTIEAASRDIAISALQRRNLIVVSVSEVKERNILATLSALFSRIKSRDIVILSRQLSTLFEAKIPALTSLKLLATETENPALKEKLAKVVEDVQGGASISDAMARQPDVFSKFYVSMVRSGEESGKLDEVFSYLASYLERNYELISKAKGALVYPAFVLTAFVGVVILMLTYVIPKLSDILKESGQSLPFYTTIILDASDFVRTYGIYILLVLIAGVIALWVYFRTPSGKMSFSRIQLDTPYLGVLYRKLYLSRIMDNFETLLSAGISAVRTLELTADVIDNEIYRQIILESINNIKSGIPLSESFSRYEDIPGLVVQMIKVGEETGKLTFVLKTLASFYKKEIDNAITTLMSLIEPVLIIILGLGVGLLVAGVLGPIYSLSAGI